MLQPSRPADEAPAGAGPPPWIIYSDGSAVPNPGRMGLGAVLVAPDGARHVLSTATDTRGCNNEAEARALMLALREVQARGAIALKIHSDSSLLVAQLAGAGAPPVLRLAALYEEAAALLESFAHSSLHWIPRHRNGEADALARAALGLAPKGPVKLRKKRKRP
jgi:ribonuclease HI